MDMAARTGAWAKSGGIVLPDGAKALDFVYSGESPTGLKIPISLASSDEVDCVCKAIISGIICIYGREGKWIGFQNNYRLTSSEGITEALAEQGSEWRIGIRNGKVTFGGVETSRTTKISTVSGDFYYGGYNAGGAFAWKGGLGRMTIKDSNGNLKIDLIPCEHNGKYGFCEIVSKTFLGEGKYVAVS